MCRWMFLPPDYAECSQFPLGWHEAAVSDQIYGWESFRDRGFYKPGMDGE